MDQALNVLYVYAADHGSGAGLMLLDAVVDPAESVALWVADPNPRAQASTATTGSAPTEQPKSTTACERSAWSAPTSPRTAARCRILSRRRPHEP